LVGPGSGEVTEGFVVGELDGPFAGGAGVDGDDLGETVVVVPVVVPLGGGTSGGEELTVGCFRLTSSRQPTRPSRMAQTTKRTFMACSVRKNGNPRARCTSLARAQPDAGRGAGDDDLIREFLTCIGGLPSVRTKEER
jgi:hypothetical protein